MCWACSFCCVILLYMLYGISQLRPIAIVFCRLPFRIRHGSLVWRHFKGHSNQTKSVNEGSPTAQFKTSSLLKSQAYRRHCSSWKIKKICLLVLTWLKTNQSIKLSVKVKQTTCLCVQLTDPVRLEMRDTLRSVYGVNMDNPFNKRVTKSWDRCQIAVSSLLYCHPVWVVYCGTILHYMKVLY